MLWSNEADDNLERLATRVEGTSAVVETTHFSTGVVMDPPPPSGALCGNGTIDRYGTERYCGHYYWDSDFFGPRWFCEYWLEYDLYELCDDGNTITESCAYGQASCVVCRSDCTRGYGAPGGRCGDGLVNGPEACDDGNTVTEPCAYGEASCTVCRADCTFGPGAVVGQCGDGTVNGPEACDDGNTVTETCAYGEASCTVCRADCTLGPGAVGERCGDGTVNGPEACDDGNTVTEPCAYGEASCTVCRADCTLGPGVVVGQCGDGTVNGPEACDDGNTVTETCNYGLVTCTVCRADCTLGPGVAQLCGDGIVNGSEQCDDGNTVTESCPPGTSCTVCRANCTLGPGSGEYCGNAVIEGDEQCDTYPEGDCSSYGFLHGDVTCSATCRNDTSQCVPYSPTVLAQSVTPRPAFFGGSSYNGRAVVWYGNGQGWDNVADDPPGSGPHVYHYVRGLGANVRVADPSNPVIPNGSVGSFSLDDLGSIVAFETTATNLVTPDANGTASDCLLWGAGTHLFERVASKTGAQPSGGCRAPMLSRSGRYLALEGSASDFGGPNGGRYYLHNRTLGTFEALDVGIGGAAPNDVVSGTGKVLISADARYAVFVSAASNLVPDDTNGKPDVFLRDRTLGMTTRLSVRNDGSQLAQGATTFVASTDAMKVAFLSDSFDYFGAPGGMQVFVRDVVANTTTHASPAPPGAIGWSVTSLQSVDGRGSPFFGDTVKTYVFIGGVSALLVPPSSPGAPTPPVIAAYYTKDEHSSVVWTGPFDQGGRSVSLLFRGQNGM